MLLAAQHPRTFCQPSTSGTAPPIHTSDEQSPPSPLPPKPPANFKTKIFLALHTLTSSEAACQTQKFFVPNKKTSKKNIPHSNIFLIFAASNQALLII
jgi:hypothetical protein